MSIQLIAVARIKRRGQKYITPGTPFEASSHAAANRLVKAGFAKHPSQDGGDLLAQAAAPAPSATRMVNVDAADPSATAKPAKPTAPPRPRRPDDPDLLAAAIIAAAASIPADKLGPDGRPNIAELQRILGYRVTAAERDAALASRT